MISTIHRPGRSYRFRLLAILAAMVAIAIVSQVASRVAPAPAMAPPPVVDPLQPAVGDLDPGPVAGSDDEGVAVADGADLARIRANVAFWGERIAANPDDFISTNRLGISEIELARATGDLDAYQRAGAAFGRTLARYPTNAAALGYRGSVLVSLHRFGEAADLARTVLDRRPDDPVALATLGDAELELGLLDAARDAYRRVDAVSPSAATEARLSRLAFITGDTTEAIRAARAAVAAAEREGAEGERAAFYHYQLAETLISSGDRPGAERAYAAAIEAEPASFLAISGTARAAAADGDLDEAIRRLTAAIAIVPQPEFLARRGDLYVLRGRDGDERRAADDYATVEAIATLAGGDGTVYDRPLALYLANHEVDVDRAVTLARDELAIRQDVYGHDTLAWALFRAGRPAEADAVMTDALAVGTRDAKLLYHAGMIDIALGRLSRGKTRLQAALDLDASFDPLQAERARETLTTLP
jgi:tetratricopeptide (TPR) repeat protein